MSFAIVSAVASIAGTVTSVYGQVESGKAQQEALEEQARQEKIAAEGRDLQKRPEVNKVLSDNVV